MFSRSYLPAANSSRMASVGDVEKSRRRFHGTERSTVRYLLDKRFNWMNQYIDDHHVGLEVGAGAGFSREYIKKGTYELTDFADFDWLDRKVDAMRLPYSDSQLDFVIESNMLHHLAHPATFLRESLRVLKPGGMLLIQDVWGSVLLRFLCRLLKTEGYSFDVDVYDEETPCCDPENLWAGNNVIPNLLFRDRERFTRAFGFEIVRFAHSEVFLFPLSGGVTSHLPAPRLPRWILKSVDFLDGVMVKIAPNLCALQVSVALRKQ
ncbi:MAG TPA: class I SAM-dependent methyltransferase [Dokdonella sp.]|nr:class I SAM-dependent methyltransferase [Dokdonella sp.]